MYLIATKCRVWIIYVIFGLVLILQQCAQPASLTGGPKDTSPPEIDTSFSFNNYQTNFTAENISIFFNEFIKLQQPSKQIIIYPKMNKKPEIYARGKRLEIIFDKELILLDNTTYALNFGEGIADFNEGNVLKNFKYVFSTGDYIDSLQLSGYIINLEDNQPAQGAIAMLYNSTRDSIILEEEPVYFGFTDSEGKFTIENIKADTFQLIMLKDANLNYIYDVESELIGFVDSLLILDEEVVYTDLGELNIFQEEYKYKILNKTLNTYGHVMLELSAQFDSVLVEIPDTSISYIKRYKDKTLHIWYKNPTDSSFYINVTHSDKHDTLTVKPIKIKKIFNDPPSFDLNTNINSGGFLNKNNPLLIDFSVPFDTVNENLIHLYEIFNDTMITVIPQLQYSNKLSDSLKIIYPWKEGFKYSFMTDSAWINNLYYSAMDSVNIEFFVLSEQDYGSITVTFDSIDFDLSDYILYVKSRGITVDTATLDINQNEIQFKNLFPGEYELVLLQDTNRNGKKDKGSYFKKELPEKTIIKKLEPLKSEWNLDVHISGFNIL